MTAVRNHSSLNADLRELIILRVAVLNRAPYEFDAHVPHALKAGLSQSKIEALRDLTAAPCAAMFSERERCVLALTDSMTRDIEVPDSVFDPVRSCFGNQQLLDLVATIAAYNMVSRLLAAFRIGQ